MAGRRRKKKTSPFAILFTLVLCCFSACIIRLFWIVIVHGDEYTQKTLSQAEEDVTSITAKRGDILDTNGVTLATSTIVYNLILDPKVILTDEDRYLEPTVSALCECFEFESSTLKEIIRENPRSSYQVLIKELTYDEIADFNELKENNADIAGVWFEENYKRNYTFDTLACAVLGFCVDGQGAYGIESEYDEYLTGVDGKEYTYVDDENILNETTHEAVNGYSIMTTIDYNIQNIVEEEIANSFKDYDANVIAVLVQDPQTGAVLAMADSNTFNCNNPWDLTLHYTKKEIAAMSDSDVTDALSTCWKNYCITEGYEPGSTFKPLTVAAALEENLISLYDTYSCTGNRTLLEETISCWNSVGHGTVTARQAIAYSCNCGLIDISQKIGAETFSKYQAKFGIGKYTDIDLPNEASCEYLIYDETMSDLDLATNSFGQNFNVTMIQMSSAYCSLINGGYYYKPYIVKGIYTDNGDLVKGTSSTLVKQTISKEMSGKIKETMRDVVVYGTSPIAAVDGYVVSGKSGTAEKSTASKEKGIYTYSFIGFAPYETPEVLCYVLVDEPDTTDTSTAVTLFHKIMSQVLPYMNITSEEDDTYPDVSGYAQGAGEND